MSADPRCATCFGRGVYTVGGLRVACLCVAPRVAPEDCPEDCPECPPGDLCDEHFVGDDLPKPGTVEAMPRWEREAMDRFEARQMREQADGRALDAEVGL